MSFQCVKKQATEPNPRRIWLCLLYLCDVYSFGMTILIDMGAQKYHMDVVRI